jgi:hypothetical protein
LNASFAKEDDRLMNPLPTREEDEFAFPVPAGWNDISTDEKAALSPLGFVRESFAKDSRFLAVRTSADGGTISALINVRVQRGLARLHGQSANDAWRALCDERARVGDQSPTLISAEVLRLSSTDALRIVFGQGRERTTWYCVPGRLNTAIIWCLARADYAAQQTSTFDAFATDVARAAETAPETWSEIEARRNDDPKRRFFSFNLWLIVAGVAVVGCVAGGALGMDPEMSLIVGATVGMVVAFVWMARGGAPTLPGGDGDQVD